MSGGNNDDVTIRLDSEGQSEVVAALESVDRAAAQADDTLDDLGRSGERAGQRVERGMDAAARGTKRARDAQGRFLPMNRAAGDGLDRTGRKARQAARGMDAYARSANRATRATGGLKAMLMLIKFGTIITGGVALVGVLGALAAGAVMAVGALSPMVGIAAALGPALFAGALAMGVFKVAGEDVKALMSPLLFSVLALRTEITRRLTPGITSLVRKLQSGLMPVVLAGMLSMADSISTASDRLGDMLTQAMFVNNLGELFQGLDPLVQSSTGVLGNFLRILVTGSLAALPMATRMAEGLERVTTRLANWLDAMTASGKAQAWLNRAWDTTIAVGKVLKDVLIGLFHIFTIGGRVAREELGGGVASAARRFREWTESGEGAARILKYFRDSVPTLKETARLLGAMAAGIGALATDPNVAPLLAQIRTELGPALGNLFRQLTEAGGLGPSLVSMFAAIATALSKIPLDGLLWVIQGFAGLTWAIAYLVDVVPGLGPAIGLLLSLAIAGGALSGLAGLAFKLGKGLMFILTPLGWIWRLLAPVLRSMGFFGFLLRSTAAISTAAGTALRLLGGALLFVGRALLMLFLANPITAAILIIVGLLIFLWFKFDWFRNGVMTALRAIGDFFVWIWRSIEDPVMAVLGGIWTVVKVVFGIIVGIIQVAVFVIVGILVGLLTLGKMIFDGIGFAAKMAWEYLIKPVWDLISWGFRNAVDMVTGSWNRAMEKIGAAAHWVYDTFIAPVVDLIKTAWNSLSGPVMTLISGFMIQWGIFRDFMMNTVFRPIGDFVSWILGGIGSAAKAVADVVGGVFSGMFSVVKSIYNFLAGGWNSIPEITVPEWVPLLGGKKFGLPKLPMLWHGGTVQYDTALVGEQGPEALVHGGRVSLLGANGPEIATGLPRGGYVVPNLDTLNQLPGLTKRIPGGVADAVSRALPQYGSLLGRRAPNSGGSPDVQVHVDTGSDAVVDAIETLAAVLVSQRGPAPQPDPAASLAAVLRAHDRAAANRGRYSYTSPRRPR